MKKCFELFILITVSSLFCFEYVHGNDLNVLAARGSQELRGEKHTGKSTSFALPPSHSSIPVQFGTAKSDGIPDLSSFGGIPLTWSGAKGHMTRRKMPQVFEKGGEETIVIQGASTPKTLYESIPVPRGEKNTLTSSFSTLPVPVETDVISRTENSALEGDKRDQAKENIETVSTAPELSTAEASLRDGPETTPVPPINSEVSMEGEANEQEGEENTSKEEEIQSDQSPAHDTVPEEEQQLSVSVIGEKEEGEAALTSADEIPIEVDSVSQENDLSAIPQTKESSTGYASYFWTALNIICSILGWSWTIGSYSVWLSYTVFRYAFSLETYLGIGFVAVIIFNFFSRDTPFLYTLRDNLEQLLFVPFYVLYSFLDKVEFLLNSPAGKYVYPNSEGVVYCISASKNGTYCVCQWIDSFSLKSRLLPNNGLPSYIEEKPAENGIQDLFGKIIPSSKVGQVMRDNAKKINEELANLPTSVSEPTTVQRLFESIFPSFADDRKLQLLKKVEKANSTVPKP